MENRARLESIYGLILPIGAKLCGGCLDDGGQPRRLENILPQQQFPKSLHRTSGNSNGSANGATPSIRRGRPKKLARLRTLDDQLAIGSKEWQAGGSEGELAWSARRTAVGHNEVGTRSEGARQLARRDCGNGGRCALLTAHFVCGALLPHSDAAMRKLTGIPTVAEFFNHVARPGEPS